MSAAPGTIASTTVTDRRSSSARFASAWAAKACASASTFSGRIERPAAARCPPKRSRCSRTGGEAGMQVEGGNGPAAALPVPFRARDQDDRAVVALDQARGDDSDHTLVPVLAGDDVAAAAAAWLGPGLDRGGRLAQDPLLDGLALPVQLLELERDPARLLLVIGQQQLQRGDRAAETAGGVDARGEPEADRTLVDALQGRPGRPASAPAGRAGWSSRGGAGRRAPARGSRRRAGRRRRSSRARPGRGSVQGSDVRARAAPPRACRRHRSRRAPGTGNRTGGSRRRDSRAARRPAGGGR